MAERLDGVRGWLGDLDSTVNLRSRIGLVLAAIAIGAAGAAIYLSLDAKNQSATNSDVGTLHNQVDSLKRQLGSTAGDVKALRAASTPPAPRRAAPTPPPASCNPRCRSFRATSGSCSRPPAGAAATPAVPTVPTPTPGTGRAPEPRRRPAAADRWQRRQQRQVTIAANTVPARACPSDDWATFALIRPRGISASMP